MRVYKQLYDSDWGQSLLVREQGLEAKRSFSQTNLIEKVLQFIHALLLYIKYNIQYIFDKCSLPVIHKK